MKGEMRLRRVVSRVSYKPGTKFSLERRGDGMSLGFHMEVEDTVNRGTTRIVDAYFDITSEWLAEWNDVQLAESLMFCAAMLELHEVYEWFMYDGKQLVNPHPVKPLMGKYANSLLTGFMEETTRQRSAGGA